MHHRGCTCHLLCMPSGSKWTTAILRTVNGRGHSYFLLLDMTCTGIPCCQTSVLPFLRGTELQKGFSFKGGGGTMLSTRSARRLQFAAKCWLSKCHQLYN